MATLSSPAGSSMEIVRLQKTALRTIVRRELRKFSPEVRVQEDEAIQKHLFSAEWYQNSKRICAYVSCASLREVVTSHILSDLLGKQRQYADTKVYVPRVEDMESQMRMLHITNMDDDLILNHMNILEPTPLDSSGNPRDEVMQANEPLDLLLLPGLAFDRKGGRLGRGGGYYDVFLQNYLLLAKDKGWKSPLLVALAYSPQIRDDPVPVDPTDVNIDALLSCNGILTFNSEAEEQISTT